MSIDKTPIQQAIQSWKDKAKIAEAAHQPVTLEYARMFVKYLEGLVDGEKEFVGKCFDAGSQWEYERNNLVKSKALNSFDFLNQLYPEK